VATVLVSRGVGAKKAAWWALFTALPQPLLAVPSFMFVDTFAFLLPLALGFAAGCMTWMVFAELIPDSLADAPHGKVSSVLITFFVELLLMTGIVGRNSGSVLHLLHWTSQSRGCPLALQSCDSPLCSA
jgi:zinc transporter ZupT